MKARNDSIEYPRLILQAAFVSFSTHRSVTDSLATIDEALSSSVCEQAAGNGFLRAYLIEVMKIKVAMLSV